MSTIAAVGIASPSYTMDQDQVESSIRKHYADRLNARSLAVVDKVFGHPSVLRRRFAFDEPEDLVDEHPDHRIARFTHWGTALSDRAARDALAQVHLEPHDISAVVVNTCTGYICPGLSTYLVESLGLRRTVLALDLVGSGCGGAVPNLQMCQALLHRDDRPIILCVSVEICSSTFQMGNDLSLLVSNALFADGAAAAVVWNRPTGLSLLASANRHVPEHRDDIRYVHKNGQLHNQLSLRLPGLAARAVAGVVDDLLRPQGLAPADIKFWALHPGGENVINAIRDEIGLSERQLRHSRDVLARFGNLSSATVWFVLKEILNDRPAPGDLCAMVAFGAGLSAHALLLRL